MQIKNGNGKKEIWFNREKFKVVQSELAGKKSTGSATRVETLIELLDKYSSSKWIETDDEIRSFCFYFPEILKTHLYNEKDKCWEKNPFNDNNFCNAMFNLLKTDKDNLSRNCVLLLEGICFPNIQSQKTRSNNYLVSYMNDNIELFFTNEWHHIPKPSDGFMNFLIEHISEVNIKDYCDKYTTNQTLKNASTPYNLIFVKGNDQYKVQTQNNFIISCLLLFLDKKFKYPFECGKNGRDFIENSMNLYENIYKNFIDLPHDNKKYAIYDFFYELSERFIECIYLYRDNTTSQIKQDEDICLLRRFYFMLKNDKESLNLILNKLSLKIDSKQDFTVLCEDNSGTSCVIEFHVSVKDNENKFSIKSKNNCKKEIWFDREKFESFRVKAPTKNWLSSANDLETLTYCLENHNSLEWVKTFDDLKNFCFYFPEILKTHLYSEKDKRWLENPFNNDDFCTAMFNLLKKDKKNLLRNCVLLLEGICFPNIRATDSSFTLLSCEVCDSIKLFFTNKLDHMPKPINKFMNFLTDNISKSDVKKYCTKFINTSLKLKLKSEELSSRKWISVQENDLDIQIQNNFVVSYLSLFLNKGFKYPSKCEKDGLDFIESAMNLYENMYKNLMDLPNDTKEFVTHDFFNNFSVYFIKDIIDVYRENKKASIKYKHVIYLFHKFNSILQNDMEHLNSVLEDIFIIINVKQDFVLPYENCYGKLDEFKLNPSNIGAGVANWIFNEKSLIELKEGQILNYQELLPGELLNKINEHNGENNLELNLTEQIVKFKISNKSRAFYWDTSGMLNFIYKMFKLISKEHTKIKNIDDIHLNDVFNLLVNNKFSLFNYITKIECFYGDAIVRGMGILISEKFETFIDYHSIKSETNQLYRSHSNDKFINMHIIPNGYVQYLHNLMITKFVKAKTQSEELAEIVSILLKKFGSVYDFVQRVKYILSKPNYGYKLRELWDLFLDCILHVDKEGNKDVLSLLISWVDKNIDESKWHKERILLDFVAAALFLITIAKGFEYETNIFCKVNEQRCYLSEKTFNLLEKVINNENFYNLIARFNISSISDFENVKSCFEQMKIFKFEDLIYLSDEICNPNMKSLDLFFELVKRCADIRKKNNQATVFDLMEKTKNLAQKKVAKAARIKEMKNMAGTILDHAKKIKQNYRDTKNSLLDKVETEEEQEMRKVTKLIRTIKETHEKLYDSILLLKQIEECTINSDLINDYLDCLYKLFCMIYDPGKLNNLNAKYQKTYREVLSEAQNKKTMDFSLIANVITNLNDKKVFCRVEKLKNINLTVVESIILLLSGHSNKTDAMLFKNKEDEDITSNIIDGLKSFEDKLSQYLNEKSNLQESNENQIVKDREEKKEKPQDQKITRSEEINSDAKDKSHSINENKNDDLQNNNDKIEDPQKNKDSENKQRNNDKDKEKQNEKNNIINQEKKIDEKQIFTEQNNISYENNNEIKTQEFKKNNNSMLNMNLDTNNNNFLVENSHISNENSVEQNIKTSENKNDDIERVSTNAPQLLKSNDSNEPHENSFQGQKEVEENKNISSKANDNTKKIQDVNNTKKDNNEKQIEEKKQNVQSKMNLKANDKFRLIKNAFGEKEEICKKTEKKRYSLNMDQHKIEFLIDNEDKNIENNQRKNNTENGVFEDKKDQNKINSITDNEKEIKINEKQISNEQNNILQKNNNANGEEKILENPVDKSDHRDFFLKKWCIFFYQHKKINVSTMTVQIIFLIFGLFFTYWLAIAAAISLVISLTIFLFGRYFSTESDSTGITTGLSSTTKNYAVYVYSRGFIPDMNTQRTSFLNKTK